MATHWNYITKKFICLSILGNRAMEWLTSSVIVMIAPFGFPMSCYLYSLILIKWHFLFWSSAFIKRIFGFLIWIECSFLGNITSCIIKFTNNVQHFFVYYRVVHEEARRSQDRKSPSRTNGCNENRSIDILEMLCKAKVEYDRVRKGGCTSLFKNCTRNCVQMIPSVVRSGSYCIFWYIV